MFIVSLRYTADLEAVDRLLPDHVAWLKDALARGTLLLAGRKVPRSGGILLTRGDDLASVEAWAATDPFVTGGVADYEIIEFTASITAPGFEEMTRS